MSARIFFAGAVVGAVVGAVAVVAFQSERASPPIVENATTATVRSEAPSRADTSPAPAPVNVVQSVADVAVPAAPEPVSPVDVASASSSDPGDEVVRSHAEMRSRGESIEQLAAKVKTEPRDDAWASNKENELRDYLARRPVPNALGATSVECRTTVCRIVSVVHDDIYAAVPTTDLQAAMGDLPDESLGRELVSMGVAMMGDPKQPGQMIEVVFLRRADKPLRHTQ